MALVLLLAVAALGGLVFERLALPGGAVIGAMLGAAALTLARGGDEVVVPAPLQTAALVVLGAMIGASVTRSTVLGLRDALLPAVLAAVLIILAGVGITYLLRLFGLAPAGDVLATSPGALSSIVGIAAERGGGAAEVALFHTVRVILVLLSLPLVLTLLPPEGG